MLLLESCFNLLRVESLFTFGMHFMLILLYFKSGVIWLRESYYRLYYSFIHTISNDLAWRFLTVPALTWLFTQLKRFVYVLLFSLLYTWSSRVQCVGYELHKNSIPSLLQRRRMLAPPSCKFRTTSEHIAVVGGTAVAFQPGSVTSGICAA